MSVLRSLVEATRPRQWVKNALVLAAPAAAGVLDDPGVWPELALAISAFIAASAGTYLLNDVGDRKADATHPVKRHRPVPAGVLPVGVAVTLATLLLLGSVLGPMVGGLPMVAMVIAIYLGVMAAYSLGLKQIAFLELVLVAAGFVLRTVAGAVAVDVPISQWFLIVISAAALHLVASKRYAELRDQGSDSRVVLDDYDLNALAEVRYASVAIALVGYLLWAFDRSAGLGGAPYFELSAVPFALAMFRYSSVVHDGAGESPEEILLGDRHILVYGTVWGALFLVGIYGAGG